MLLGYSFEPRPNSCAPAKVGLVMINGCSQSQFDEREQDWLVQKFGLRRPQSFNAIQAEPFFLQSHTRRQKETLLAGRVNRQIHCHILIWHLFTIPSPTSFSIWCSIIGIRYCSLFNEWTTNKAFSSLFDTLHCKLSLNGFTEGVDGVNWQLTNGQNFSWQLTNHLWYNRQLTFALGFTVNWQRTWLSSIFYKPDFYGLLIVL